MKKRILFVICLMSLLSPTIPARADVANPQVDELAETKLDGELEAEDSSQIIVDQKYAQEEAANSNRELTQAKKETDSLKNKNEKASVDIQGKLAQIETEKRATEEAQASIEKLQIELVNNKKEIDRLREEVNTVKIERGQIKQKQGKAKTDLAVVAREKQMLVRQEAKLNRDIKVASSQLKTMQTRHAKMVAQNKTMKAHNHKKEVALHLTKTRLAKNSQN